MEKTHGEAPFLKGWLYYTTECSLLRAKREPEKHPLLSKVMGTTAAVQAVTPEAVKVTGASSKAATDLEEGVQKQTGTSEAAPVGNVVKAPLVGTFYAAPAEDAEPFIQVGDSVKKGQSVAIIEAMKLMNEIESDFDGTVTEILVKNGQAVEYGQPLFRIA